MSESRATPAFEQDRARYAEVYSQLSDSGLRALAAGIPVPFGYDKAARAALAAELRRRGLAPAVPGRAR